MGDQPQYEVGAFDPVHSFQTTLFDLVTVVELFQEANSTMTPQEFLQAQKVARERMEAIVEVSMMGLTAPVAQKIPPEVMAEFRSQQDLDDLMLSPEEKHKRMIKAIKDIATWRRHA